jgi:pimeloyl-[acyl-carrier protein] synthase
MAESAQEIEALLDASEFPRDPYPAYRALLAFDSPHWSDARGAWLISRHDQVVGALRDWQHFSSAGRVGTLLDHFSAAEWDELEGLRRWTALRGIIHADPPEHTRFRGLFVRAFTTRAVERLAPRVQSLVDELLAPALERGELDVVADLALPLPAAVISHVLGVPDADRHRFVAWSDAALGIQGRARPTLEVARRASEAYAALMDYFAALVDDRRRHPPGGNNEEDFVTGLLRATDDDPEMAEADVIQSCITLLMGGYETTTSLISNTVALLLERPDLLAAVRADPALLVPTVEESLRYECPIQTITRRIANDVRLGDATLRAGDLAILMMGAANRDPRRFEAPDRFDIERTDRHIAFGYGIHLCVGASLARLEAPIAVGALLERLPGLALATGQVAWNEGKPVTRCPSTLPVVFRTAA